jgi:hypothetical protein
MRSQSIHQRQLRYQIKKKTRVKTINNKSLSNNMSCLKKETILNVKKNNIVEFIKVISKFSA